MALLNDLYERTGSERSVLLFALDYLVFFSFKLVAVRRHACTRPFLSPSRVVDNSVVLRTMYIRTTIDDDGGGTKVAI